MQPYDFQGAREAFIDWSLRRDVAEGYGSAPEPEFAEPIGARRAA